MPQGICPVVALPKNQLVHHVANLKVDYDEDDEDEDEEDEDEEDGRGRVGKGNKRREDLIYYLLGTVEEVLAAKRTSTFS